jgi:sortase A
VKPATEVPPAQGVPQRRSLFAERAAWTVGLAAIAICSAAYLTGEVGARRDLARFETSKVASVQRSAVLPSTPRPDLSLWDVKRISEWRAALTQPAPAPLGILRISKIGLEVAVLPGTDDFVLNRAVGHIEDTALPGANGNAGIAGHRDGFFRALKDVLRGDTIELETLDGRQSYRVERTWIVDPEDVSVLDPTPVRSLTLVTCYPFYYVGPAPERFIVRAVASDTDVPLTGR